MATKNARNAISVIKRSNYYSCLILKVNYCQPPLWSMAACCVLLHDYHYDDVADAKKRQKNYLLFQNKTMVLI